MAARLALAARNEIFFPTFAMLAITKKYMGASGESNSTAVDKSKATAETMRHTWGHTRVLVAIRREGGGLSLSHRLAKLNTLGVASNLELTKDENTTHPS